MRFAALVETAGGRRALQAIGLSSALVYLGLNEQGPLALRLPLKLLPVLCLVLWTGVTQPNRYGRRLTAGLFLALVGDAFLIFPGEPAFLGGLVFNLLAHLGYIAAFLSAERTLRLGRAMPFVVWTGSLFALLLPTLGGMKLPVALYSLAITAMMWRAAALIGEPASTRRSQWAGLLGALGFALCDSLIAINKFHHPLAGAQVAIMTFYWLGQLGLSLSANRSPREDVRAIRGASMDAA
jgi:uncharacterized membrane protein YhhN